MPNWCSNIMIVDGAKDEILRFQQAAQGQYDDKPIPLCFGSLYPMPPELKIESGSNGSIGEKVLRGERLGEAWLKDIGSDDPKAVLAHFEREHPECLEMGRKYLANREKYGFPTWYEWSVAHWGTKWDLCDDTDAEFTDRDTAASLRYAFDTAWSPPLPWLTKVAADWPSLRFSLEWVEPGVDCAGRTDFVDGEPAYVKEFQTLASFYYEVGDDGRGLDYAAISEALAP